MDPKRDLKFSKSLFTTQASRLPLKMVKDSPPLQAKVLVILLPGTEIRLSVSINVKKTRKNLPETFMARA